MDKEGGDADGETNVSVVLTSNVPCFVDCSIGICLFRGTIMFMLFMHNPTLMGNIDSLTGLVFS
jgi:hypothetical protein